MIDSDDDDDDDDNHDPGQGHHNSYRYRLLTFQRETKITRSTTTNSKNYLRNFIVYLDRILIIIAFIFVLFSYQKKGST